MPIDKFLEQFSYDPENFDPEKFKQDALAEYAKDREVWDAKVSTVTTERDTALDKVTRVQAHNYDLLQAAGIQTPGQTTPGAAGNDETGQPRPIESLFKKE